MGTWSRRAWDTEVGPGAVLLLPHFPAKNVGSRRGSPKGQSHPTLLPWGREAASWVSWVESQPFRGGRASRAFGLRETCQPASSSLNPILRKPSLSYLPLSSRW